MYILFNKVQSRKKIYYVRKLYNFYQELRKHSNAYPEKEGVEERKGKKARYASKK